MGDCIKYIAMQKSSSKMAKLKCWNVVSLWPSKSQRETNTLTRELSESSLFSVTANLREMTSEGGDLTFGPDSWAHRVSFSWEQVLSHFVSKSLVAQLDDRFWCIVKNDVMMGVTKWVADELIKCDSNLEPPERFKACSKVCLPSTQFSLGRDSGLGGSGETLFNSDSGSSLLTPPLKSENLMDQNLSDIFDRNLNFADYCLGVNPIAPDVNLMKTDVDKTDDDDDDPWTALTDQKYDSIMDGTGTVISKTAYGGVLETTADIAIPFDAHSFYFNGRPISHLVVDVGSRVHFNARQVGQDANLVAFQVWMGTKPQSNSKLLN